MHSGRGPGLSDHALGEAGGELTVRLQEDNLPTHKHQAKYSKDVGTTQDPTGRYIAKSSVSAVNIWAKDDKQNYIPMASSVLEQAGGEAPHENRQPFLVVPFFIALDGVYPPRS